MIPNLYKYLSAALGTVAVGLGIACFVMNLQMDTLQAKLDAALAQVETLKVTIGRQNDQIATLGEQVKAKAEEVLGITKPATKKRIKAQNNVTVMLDYKPVGSTLEERVLDVDNRFLKELNQ